MAPNDAVLYKSMYSYFFLKPPLLSRWPYEYAILIFVYSQEFIKRMRILPSVVSLYEAVSEHVLERG